MRIHAKVEERAGEKTEQRRVEARTEPMRREFADCPAAGAEGGEMKARLWSLLRRRMESCRGCMTGGEVEGHLASLEDGCRLRCGVEEDQVIACSQAGVEVGLAKQQQQRQVLVEEVAAAEAGSLVASLMKESRLEQHCQLIHIGEEIPGGARELHCGKSSGVPQWLMKGDENRHMVFGSAKPAYQAPGPRCQGSSFACCTVSPGYRPMLSSLPCGGLYPVAWQRRPDERGYPGPEQV